jgi:cystathionine beta-lyase
MSFDTLTHRIGTGSTKWDMMQPAFGISPDEGLPMWVADKDFEAPDFLQKAMRGLLDRADYGYFCDTDSFHDAIVWWQETRHGWQIDGDWLFTTGGLGNAIALTIQCFTDPGDHVAILTPVYHEFAAKIGRTDRVVTELPLAQREGVYALDFDAVESRMTGKEKILLISSPHNPAGRVWTPAELQQMAQFCDRHDLLLVSDEVHGDLVFEGHRFVPTHLAVPGIAPRLIAMSAASKTFSVAGARTGYMMIPDPALRARFARFFRGFDISPNLLGVTLTRAAYSPEGAAWVDQLMPYLQSNRDLFCAGVDDIPGLRAMPMQSTYLAWVDFAATGMDRAEIHDRLQDSARIAATPGYTLGTGGETFMRFNLGTQRARVEEALARLSQAFADLQ